MTIRWWVCTSCGLLWDLPADMEPWRGWDGKALCETCAAIPDPLDRRVKS